MTLKRSKHPALFAIPISALCLLSAFTAASSFAVTPAKAASEGEAPAASAATPAPESLALDDQNQQALESSLAKALKLAAGLVPAEDKEETITLLRLYNRWTGEHFYTADPAERDHLVSIGWNDEGEGWVAPATSTSPVHRLYNPYAGDHHYTMDSAERDNLVKVGWNDEGVGWYSADGPQARVALYRQYNPNARRGNHNFTLDSNEHCNLVKQGWRPEGAAWFAITAAETLENGWVFENGDWRYRESGNAVANRWVVTDKPAPTALIGGGLNRYWIDTNGALARDRRIRPGSALDQNAGYEACAAFGGNIERNNTFLLEGTYWTANDDGKIWQDDVVNRLVSMAQQYSSPTKYLLMVDIDNPKTMVFEGSKGNWKVKFIWDCCTGAPSTPTITGVFRVGIKGYSFGENHGYSCYYYTQFSGNYLFHTRKYYPRSRTLLDGRMGERVSEGCVRLYDEDAIWIQKNVSPGTTVVSTR